ncbi:TLC domain-containing protein [Lipomyces oligophaga]|uniref:TLC domain-containing protein n=1 Tax=Lipomyces oligophaga TaxID=45792 RepID=UPI0034CF0FDC
MSSTNLVGSESPSKASGTLRPQAQRRRTSSVGEIALGDTSSPSLSTMTPTENQLRASRNRQRALSGSIGHGSSDLSDGGHQSSSLQTLSESKSNVQRSGKQNGQAAESSTASLWWTRYRELAYQKTWLNPFVFTVFISLVYLVSPKGSLVYSVLKPFLTLSYPAFDASSGKVMYGKGLKDFCFVAFYTVVFTFIREFCMQQILEPLARYSGLRKKGKIDRFMEQTYAIIYYGVMAPWGLWIMYHMPLWYFETKPMFENYPHKSHELQFKAYYLLQASFWVQQSVVLMLQLEKPRKDFKELVFHHVVTIALIFCSYKFHFTWMGLPVYITMDLSDLMLSISKTMNYLNHWLTGPFFLVFMGVWIYLRHYLNLRILYAVATEFATVGPFDLDFSTQQYKCWISQYITFTLIFALQAVNVYWLVLIIRVAYRFVFLDVQEDVRSEDEDEDAEVEGEDKKTI